MNWRRNILFLVVSGVLFYLVLRNIPFQALQLQFTQAHPVAIAAVSVVLLAGLVFRGWRWQLMLQNLDYTPSLFGTTVAILVGSLASMIIPGAGELTRCSTLERTDAVPVAKGIGSVVAERLVDLLMLALMVTILFFLEFNRLSDQLSQILLTRLQQGATSPWFWVGVVVVILFIWLGLRLTNRFMTTRFGTLVNQFRQGLRSLYSLPNPTLYILLTLLIYLSALFATYLTFITTPALAGLTFRIAFVMLTVSSLGGLAVPTQAGVGTFHALVQFVLVNYGYTARFGAITATYIHAILYGLTLLFSLLGFALLAVRFTARTQKG